MLVTPVPYRKPTGPEVLALTQRYYTLPGNGVGGNLHIVLDDGNIDNRSVAFCIDQAVNKGDVDGEQLGKLLLLMSQTQRRKLCARLNRRSV